MAELLTPQEAVQAVYLDFEGCVGQFHTGIDSGYWERNAGIRAWASLAGVEPHFVHSGGHAWPEDLQRLVAAIGAKELVVVHTDAESHQLRLPQ